MSFWVIFLCLLIGTVVGFEFGKYTVSRKVHVILDQFGNDLKKAAAELEKRAEEAKRKKEQEEKVKELQEDGQRN